MRMWARTQLHIGWRDLVSGAMACLNPGEREVLAKRAEDYWSDDRHTLATFSVRAGFDLLLQTLDLEHGDEIVFSAINVKGMAKIAKSHGLVTVPLDLDVAKLAPCPEQLERILTPRSKVLVVAHLFGAVLDLDAVFDVARRHGLVIVEDCAQAFDGQAYPGHPNADVSMFSFGPLKTATALGGGLIRLRDKQLADRMRETQRTYPIQSNKSHFKRVVKFCLFKFISLPAVFGFIYRVLRLLGRDYDDAIGEQVRNVAPQGSAKKYRRRPSAALLNLLVRRLYTFSEGELGALTERGSYLLSKLGSEVIVPGTVNPRHHFWLFPVIAKNPKRFIAELKERGYDSSGWLRSKAVAPPDDRQELRPNNAEQILHDLVFVPCYPSMSEKELAREAQAITEITRRLDGSGEA